LQGRSAGKMQVVGCEQACNLRNIWEEA